MTAPRSVTDLDIHYTHDFSCPIIETDNGDMIGVNYENKADFLKDLEKVLHILQVDYPSGFPLTENDVRVHRAVSIENPDDELYLYWQDISRHIPYSFDVYLFEV